MANIDDAREIVRGLPGTVVSLDGYGFAVPDKRRKNGFAWVWNERLEPKKPRVPNPAVLAVMVTNLLAKEMLLKADPEKFFTEPHYHGFPAVLVRLPAISKDELRDLLIEAWKSRAPDKLQSIG